MGIINVNSPGEKGLLRCCRPAFNCVPLVDSNDLKHVGLQGDHFKKCLCLWVVILPLMAFWNYLGVAPICCPCTATWLP